MISKRSSPPGSAPPRPPRGRKWAAWLAEREIGPLAAGAALATLSARYAPWGLALLALTWVVRRLGRGRWTARTPFDLPALLLVAMAGVSLWMAPDRREAAVELARLLAGLALAYGLVNWARDARRLRLLGLGLAGLGLGLALYTPFSTPLSLSERLPFVPHVLYGGALVQVEDTVNANMMAGALAALLPFGLAAAIEPAVAMQPAVAVHGAPWKGGRRLGARLFGAVAALGTAAALVLSGSRGGWAAGAVGVAVLLAAPVLPGAPTLPTARRPAVRALLGALGVGLLAAAVLLAAVVLLSAPGEVASASRTGGLAAGPGAERTLSGRVEIWSRALDVVRDFPLTGAGAGSFARTVDALYPPLSFGPQAGVPHAHNLFLQVAVDLGLPGLVAYLALLLLALCCAVDAARLYRRRGEGDLAALAWAGLAALAAVLAHGTVDATTWIVGRGAWVPWAVIGTIGALHRSARRSECHSDPQVERCLRP